MQDIFNRPKFDSFTISIPFEKCKIIDSTFGESFIKVYSNTAEIEENKDFYNNYITKKDSKTQTFVKYKIVEQLTAKGRAKFVQIMLTSKLLLKDYFQGINLQNIDFILDRINSEQIIFIEKQTFLSANVTDIDICKDFKLNTKQFNELKKAMIQNVLPNKQKYVESKSERAKELFGLQLNSRAKATPTNPFAKLYCKTIELQKKSKDFYIQNLQEHHDEIIKQGIARFEVTIKAQRHKDRLNISHVKTLNELLSLTTAEMNDIYQKIIYQYFKPTKRTFIEISKDLKGYEIALINSIDWICMLDSKITTAEILNKLLQGTTNKKQKFDLKKMILRLINEHTILSKKIAQNDSEKEEVTEVLKSLKIYDFE